MFLSRIAVSSTGRSIARLAGDGQSGLVPAMFGRSWHDQTAAYMPARLDLSAASSPTLDAAVLGKDFNATETKMMEPGAGEWRNVDEEETRCGNVSLHSAMQSNVPDPYQSHNKSPSPLNMPTVAPGRRQIAGERINLRMMHNHSSSQ